MDKCRMNNRFFFTTALVFAEQNVFQLTFANLSLLFVVNFVLLRFND